MARYAFARGGARPAPRRACSSGGSLSAGARSRISSEPYSRGKRGAVCHPRFRLQSRASGIRGCAISGRRESVRCRRTSSRCSARSIDDTTVIDEAVTRVKAATGLAPVLVCHSMGGLAARAWLRAAGGSGRAHHVVTIGTPHRGTWLGRFGHTLNGREMRLDGEWVAQLAHTDPRRAVHLLVLHMRQHRVSRFDSELPGADNRLVRGAAHVSSGSGPKSRLLRRDFLGRPRLISHRKPRQHFISAGRVPFLCFDATHAGSGHGTGCDKRGSWGESASCRGRGRARVGLGRVG